MPPGVAATCFVNSVLEAIYDRDIIYVVALVTYTNIEDHQNIGSPILWIRSHTCKSNAATEAIPPHSLLYGPESMDYFSMCTIKHL
jgi:hypothetical protein